MKFSAKKVRFLLDVVIFTCSAFGGAQAHLAIMLNVFVVKRRYITESDLIELNALTQLLPGPSSTQTLIAVAYKIGGLLMAFLAFVIWITPSAAIMCLFAAFYAQLVEKELIDKVLQFVIPMVVGTVGYAAFNLSRTVLKGSTSYILAFAAALATLLLKSPFVFPILILLGGIISSALETTYEESQLRIQLFSNINRKKALSIIGILLFFALLGALINQTSPFSLPIRLFENFYRNGILIFGGGQVLVPMMFTEFVQMKSYLSSAQFLSGYAFQQILPGPTFSFASFIGSIAMKNAGEGWLGILSGSIVATLGINLPGVILVLFIVPFWNDLKKITLIKNSLSGITAVSIGFIIAGFLLLLKPAVLSPLSAGLVVVTFLILNFTKIKVPYLLLLGFLIGFFY